MWRLSEQIAVLMPGVVEAYEPKLLRTKCFSIDPPRAVNHQSGQSILIASFIIVWRNTRTCLLAVMRRSARSPAKPRRRLQDYRCEYSFVALIMLQTSLIIWWNFNGLLTLLKPAPTCFLSRFPTSQKFCWLLSHGYTIQTSTARCAGWWWLPCDL